MIIVSNYINSFTFYEDAFFYENKNILGDYVRIEKIGQDIVFTTNYVSCPRIAYCITNDNFIFDLGYEAISSFVSDRFNGDTFKEVEEEPCIYFKESVRKDYKIKHIDFIENWSKVIVHSNGSFEKFDYPLIPYSIELKDAYDIIHKWLLKYKQGVDLLIRQNRFIPTLTGGVDTRCLTALWRNNLIEKFYIKEIKNDNKNRVELGNADLECALKVASRLGISNYTNNLGNCITLSGMFTEATRGMYKMNVNDERFIYKFIQHQIRGNKILLPFADDLYLQIRQPKKDIFRCLLSLLLCPDLLDLEYIGTQKTFEKYNYQPYHFNDEYGELIKEAREILEYWGREKCENILKEDTYESIR